jgi:cytochrome d ubiquinol oxidase subunit II
MSELALPDLVAAILAASLNAYVLFGGADFGGGVWDLLASGPRKARQRELIGEAIGPIWEANHVWLILAIVLTFTCFPPVFARLGIVLHIPLTLMLVGIVLRGSAFTFRSYDSDHDAAQLRWGRIFSSASVLTPLLLGVCIGAIATGRVGAALEGGFRERFVDPWWNPFALSVGCLTLALFAFLAAVYLTVESRDRALAEDFRSRALASGVVVFLAAGTALILSFGGRAPLLPAGLLGSGWALPLHLVTGGAALGTLAALWFRRYRLARVAAAAQVSLILWGWALSQYPYLLPPRFTVHGSASPPETLRLAVIALFFGSLILAPSLVYLFKVFKSAPAAEPRGSVGRADREVL